MKVCLFGIAGIPLGRQNVKDPRLDQADRLVEAQKKTYAQVDTVGEKDALEADVIIARADNRSDLVLNDLEFIETRLSRDPSPAEAAVLNKLKGVMEQDRFMAEAGLTADELQAVTAHSFYTNKPIIVAEDGEPAEKLILRAFQASGYICFLTVGGKENRAWPIRKGASAWEAAGAIHTDIQKGFIRAEIINFADFLEAGGETQAKRAGKQRLETKTYVMQDHDLTNFRFNK